MSELPTDPGFARTVEECELAAWLDLSRSAENARHFKFEEINGAPVLLDTAPNWPHSRIFNLGVGRPTNSQAIDAILHKVREAGITTLATEISPIARPGTLARLLTNAGFQQTGRNVIVARRAAQMNHPDDYFRLRAATPADRESILDLMDEVMPGARDWCAVLTAQIGRPQWRYSVALEDGAICGVGGAYIDGEMAWLPPIWVKSDHRNRGTHAALIAHAVREADTAGVQWVTTSYPASTAGRPRNFERLGFSIVYLRNRFVWQAER